MLIKTFQKTRSILKKAKTITTLYTAYPSDDPVVREGETQGSFPLSLFSLSFYLSTKSKNPFAPNPPSLILSISLLSSSRACGNFCRKLYARGSSGKA